MGTANCLDSNQIFLAYMIDDPLVSDTHTWALLSHIVYLQYSLFSYYSASNPENAPAVFLYASGRYLSSVLLFFTRYQDYSAYAGCTSAGMILIYLIFYYLLISSVLASYGEVCLYAWVAFEVKNKLFRPCRVQG